MAKKINFSKNENNDLSKFLKILVIVLLFIGVVAIITIKFVSKNESETSENVSINYDKTLIGNMFNHNESEYYVIIYDFDSENASDIENIISNYKVSENYKKIYTADLGEGLNAKYQGETNKNAKTIEEISIADLALLHFENNEITEYLDDLEEIKNVLK